MIQDTPNLGRWWCPHCEPDRDPTREILDVRPCDEYRHLDGIEGTPGMPFGSMESGGRMNKLWCDVIYGRRELPTQEECEAAERAWQQFYMVGLGNPERLYVVGGPEVRVIGAVAVSPDGG